MSETAVAIKNALESRIAAIEQVIPAPMRGQAERFVKRALLTLSRNSATYQGISPLSFVRTVISAAELGLSIDGKLAHAVPYGGELQLIVDYKGKVAVAKRNGTIKDCFAEVVREGDHFECGVRDSRQYLTHKPDLYREGGDVLGAYAVLILPDDSTRHVWMRRGELDLVERQSKARSGPWKDWPDEMRKKTVIHRALKLYCHDEGIQALIRQEDELGLSDEKRAVPNAADLVVGMISGSPADKSELDEERAAIQQESPDLENALTGKGR